MAGKHQHHVWQHIQRGFSVEEYNDNHIWIYTRDSAARKSVTRTYGQQKFFYGEQNSAADQNITDLESRLSGLITAARSSKDGAVLDTSLVAPLISLLEMRSAFIRAEMSRMSQRLLEELKKALSSKKSISALVKSYLQNHPNFLDDSIKKLGPNVVDQELIKLFVEIQMPSLIENASKSLAPNLNNAFSLLQKEMADIAKNSHIKALESDILNVDRTRLHSLMTYKIARFSKDCLVLPDTGIAFLTENGVRPLSQKSDRAEIVFIPISSNMMILGSDGPTIDRSIDTINRILASCSFESFISKHISEECKRNAKRIGVNAKLLSDSEIKKILNLSRI